MKRLLLHRADQLDAVPATDPPAGATTVTVKRYQAGPAAQLDPMLIDMAQLARLTSLSVRTLRRMDSAHEIPGRVVVGRRVLFQTEVIRDWVRAGLPGNEQWAAIQKRNGKR